MNHSLIEFYRCPEDAAKFALSGKLSEESGFFRLGDAICYGKCSGGLPASSPAEQLYDAEEHVQHDGHAIHLPFDPSQVLDNLRLERYMVNMGQARKSSIKNLLRRVYYLFRPALHVSVRKHIQRAHLRGWDTTPFPRWPVDFSVENIQEKMMVLALQAGNAKRIPFIWFWPQGYSNGLIMTHDVETRWGKDFCKSLMDIDDLFGVKSSFQVVPEERYSVSNNFLQGIRDRGFEINVHDLNHDGLLFQDRQEFLRRAKRINKYVQEFQTQGYRSGVMYRNQEWYDAFQFSYDMSVPNVAHLDLQRGGCCTVMPYFNGNILELPVTTTQDYPLFNILGDHSINLWQEQIQLIRKKYGLISFIIHPDYIRRKKPRDTYIALLQYLSKLRSEGNIWFTLPAEVNRWWRERSQMKLCKYGDTYEIVGLGKERACLAYASLTEGRLTYALEKDLAIANQAAH